MPTEAVLDNLDTAAATEPKLILSNHAPITYESALEVQENVIREAQYAAKTEALYRRLWEERGTIEALTKHHLGLGDEDVCTVACSSRWIRGGFNICIPVTVQSPNSCRKLMFRCAMPHKLAEAEHPGSIDEKMGCEVGTYAWMQKNCWDIRIPFLYGFCFYNHRPFTHATYRPPLERIAFCLRRLLHHPLPCPTFLSDYVRHPTTHRLPTAYMILEDVNSDTSEILSNTWDKERGDPMRRQRLFRDIARIMLSLARNPQPHIGSFRFHDDGTVALTNRPLMCFTMILENDGTPRTVCKDETYQCTTSFLADLFDFHDKRFLSHPNAAYDDKDCRGQMAAKVLLRALAHRFVRRDHRNGPFFLLLDDLQPGNIFVDKDWNITCLVDLEWVSASPVEMMAVPYWLTGRAIDGLRKEYLAEFDEIRREFMEAFDKEECKAVNEQGFSFGRIMQESWESGGTWFWYSLTSTNAMYPLFRYHIGPRFAPLLLFKEEELCSRFWSEDSTKIVHSKVAERDQYKKDLQHVFSQVA